MTALHYHLAGVAGVGMSSLAQALLHEGHIVTGSDRYFDAGRNLDVIDKLGGAGVRLLRQDGGGLTADTAGLVVSTAIEEDNADLVSARRLNVPLIHRAAMLAKHLAGKRCVAVTGTSGKSTVTGMIGWILQQAGADPTVVNGAPVLNWVDDRTIGNFRGGRAGVWVFEADESDRSLLQYHPDWAVITNVSKDHFEIDTALELFGQFKRQVKQGLVSAIDEPHFLAALRAEATGGGMAFEHGGERFEVRLRGLHNAENALLAVVLCERLGCDAGHIREALRSFKGIQRRLETIGAAGGVTVVDDYAHNPAKIRAAWRATASHSRRIVGIWRPHGYGPLLLMLEELTTAFVETCRPEDCLFILPVFDAGGTANRTVTSGMLVDRLRERGVAADEAQDPDQLVAAVSSMAREGDTILTMGARDPGLPALARRMLAALPGAGA